MSLQLPQKNARRRYAIAAVYFRLVALLCCLCQLQLQQHVQAQSLNLNLSSTKPSLHATNLPNAPISIRVGGGVELVRQTTALTPAEFIAVEQVITTAHQSLIINKFGGAAGGSFNFATDTGAVANLLVPRGVRAIADFSSVSALSAQGSLTNFGTVLAYSNNANRDNGTLSAGSIFNGTGGLITSVPIRNFLPDSGFSSKPFDLALIASTAIVNQGRILSSGNISLSAPTISNSGQLSSQSATVALAANQVANAGLVKAASNISIQNLTGNSLSVDNSGGRLVAGADINLSTTAQADTAAATQAQLNETGGLLRANAVRVSAPDAAVNIAADRIDGGVYVNGGTAAISAKQGNLDLVDVQTTGDPIFYLAGGGTLTLGSFSSQTPSDYVALSKGDITSTPGTTINTSGGNVWIWAGYGDNWLGGGTGSATDGHPCTNCTGHFTNDVNTPWGYAVALNDVSVNTANPSGGPAGAITVKGATVSMSNGTLDSSAAGVGDAGNITVLAFTGISGQNMTINANGGSTGGNAGNIVINTGSFGSGGSVGLASTSINANSTVGNAGSITVQSTTLQPSTLFVGGSISASVSNAGNGGSIHLQYPTSTQPFVIGTAATGNGVGGNIWANGGPNGGDGGNIDIFAYGAGGLTMDSTSRISVSAPAGNGGNIWLGATTMTIPTGYFDASAGKGNGGTVQLSAVSYNITNGPLTLIANGGGNGSGGTIFIISAPEPTGGNIVIGSVSGGFVLSATGGSSGSNGGDGGKAWITSYGNLTIDANAINLTPLGINGNGGTAYLSAASALITTGVLNANGVGTGAGGTVIINYMQSNGGSVRLESNSTVDIGGQLYANPGPGGTGGSITINSDHYIYVEPYTIVSAPTIVIFAGAAAGTQTGTNPNPSLGVTPANVVINSASFPVYFSGGITADAPTNYINATAGSVTFDVGKNTSSAIELGGGVIINSGPGYQNSGTILSSLDLTDPTVVAQIVHLQQQDPVQFGGALTVTNGVATGGNLIVQASQIGTLTAENIPSGVTVTLANAQPGVPIDVDLTAGSHTQQVVIAGVEQFVGNPNPSNATINIASVAAGPVLQLSGQLTSDGSLTINTRGDSIISGVASAVGALALRTIATGGTITLSGTISSGGTMTLSADGVGAVQQAAGTISANSFQVSSVSGQISIASAAITHSATFATGGNLTLTGIHASDISAQSSGGVINLAGNINADGARSDGSGGSINLVGAVNILASTILSANGSGNGSGGSISVLAPSLTFAQSTNLTINANGSGSGNGGSVSVSTTDPVNGNLAIGTGSGQVTISATGGSAGSSVGSGGQVALSAANSLVLDMRGLMFAPLGTNGDGASLTVTVGNQGTGSLSVLGGSVVMDGVGTGKGGSFSVVAHTAQTVSINTALDTGGNADEAEQGLDGDDGIISANAGTSGGAGGTISITNDAGGLFIHTTSISANATTTDAGSVILSSAGTLEDHGSLTANSASGNGGSIQVVAGSLFVPSAFTVQLAANGGAGGNGGQVFMSTTSSALTVGAGLGTVNVSATGGSTGSGTGNGGVITLSSAQSLQIDADGVVASPQGQNGNGGSLIVSAQGPVSVTGTLLDLAGQGTGVGGQLSITTTDSIELSSGISANGQQGGTITVTSLNPAVNLQIAGNLSLAGVGGQLGSITLSPVTGAANVQITGSVNAIFDASAASINITSTASQIPLTLGNITASSGDVTATTKNGAIVIAGTALIVANGGNIVIEDDDTTSGAIQFQSNSVVRAISNGSGGNISISIGSSPTNPQVGVPPSQLQVLLANGGQVFLNGGVSASGAANLAAGFGGTVSISTGNLPASAISLLGGVRLEARTAVLQVSSLDLTDPQALQSIQSFQAYGTLGGSISDNNGNYNGNIVIQPGQLTNSLSAASIPAGVTVTFEGFGPTAPVNINLSAASSTPSVIIAGTMQFVGLGTTASAPILNISSNQSQSALQVFGALTSDGALNISVAHSGVRAAPDVDISGTITAAGNFVLNADQVTVRGSGYLAGGSLSFTGLTADGLSNAAMQVDNSGVIKTTTGLLSITSAPGQNLLISSLGAGIWTAPGTGTITFTASQDAIDSIYGSVTFQGSHTFDFGNAQTAGVVNVNATGPTASITLANNAVLDFVSPNTGVALNTSTLLNNGTLNLNNPPVSGSHLFINGTQSGIIADSQSIDLTGMYFEFPGYNLTIISGGNIVSAGATQFDLSNSNGAGGNLTLLAGVSFTPATSGPVGPNNATYTINAQSSSQGSILLSDASITTSGTTFGGWIQAIANGGAVSLGNIETRGVVQAGSVWLLGSRVTTADIVTQAPTFQSGTVNIYAGSPTRTSSLTISANEVPFSAFWQSMPLSGNISVGSINAGNGGVSLNTDGAGGSITFSTLPLGSSVQISAGAGTINFPTAHVAAWTDSNGNAGRLSISAGSLTYPGSETAPLWLSADGSGTGNGGGIFVALPGVVKVGKQAGEIELSASGKSAGFVSVGAGGNLFVDGSAITLQATGFPGTGGEITLIAGNDGPGNLQISGSLNASAQNAGGQIELSSNSKLPFVIGKATANGISGSFNVQGNLTGGSVTIYANAGNIMSYESFASVGSLNLTASSTRGRIISTVPLQAANSINLELGLYGLIVAPGTITAPSIYIGSGREPLRLATNTDRLSVFTDGNATITNNGDLATFTGSGANLALITKSVTYVENVSVTGNFTVRSAGSYMRLSQTITAGRTIAINDPGATIELDGNISTEGRYAGGIVISAGPIGPGVPPNVQYQINGVPRQYTPRLFYVSGINASASNILDSYNNQRIILGGGSHIILDAPTTITAGLRPVSVAEREEIEIIVDSGDLAE